MIIGISSGNFYRIFPQRKKNFLIDDIYRIKERGWKAIEIHASSEKLLDLLLNEMIDFSSFCFISLHAPEIDIDGEKIMAKIDLINSKYKINNFIFHYKNIADLKILKKYSHLPISLENMDKEKNQGKEVKDFKKIFSKYDFNLTLDLQHCYTNDRSMKTALDFQKVFGKRIVEYHISGYKNKFKHYPLFKTKQKIIIDSLMKKNVPIIIESTFDDVNDDKKEEKYIQKIVDFTD
jgi:uncharacterized protein (UPF0276 family)